MLSKWLSYPVQYVVLPAGFVILNKFNLNKIYLSHEQQQKYVECSQMVIVLGLQQINAVDI